MTGGDLLEEVAVLLDAANAEGVDARPCLVLGLSALIVQRAETIRVRDKTTIPILTPDDRLRRRCSRKNTAAISKQQGQTHVSGTAQAPQAAHLHLR